jgi:hypothetical protein
MNISDETELAYQVASAVNTLAKMADEAEDIDGPEEVVGALRDAEEGLLDSLPAIDGAEALAGYHRRER